MLAFIVTQGTYTCTSFSFNSGSVVGYLGWEMKKKMCLILSNLKQVLTRAEFLLAVFHSKKLIF